MIFLLKEEDEALQGVDAMWVATRYGASILLWSSRSLDKSFMLAQGSEFTGTFFVLLKLIPFSCPLSFLGKTVRSLETLVLLLRF